MIAMNQALNNTFDPSALQGVMIPKIDAESRFDGPVEHTHSISDDQVRKRCASLKLAAQIITRAYFVSADLEQGQVIAAIAQVLKRVAAVRQVCLQFIGVSEDHPDYAEVFFRASTIALDTVTEEYKWRQSGGRTQELALPVLSRLMEAVGSRQPSLFGQPSGPLNLSAARKLAVLHATPVMMGLINFFDYFVKDVEAMTNQLVFAVAQQADYHALSSLAGGGEQGNVAMIGHAYEISASIMAEVYKACAAKDVSRLRGMQDMDRSIHIANYERIGGMDYKHIFLEHQRAMRMTCEVCNLIVDAQMEALGENVHE